MFLKVEAARQGAIKGEAQDAKHPSEIDIVSWSWGMRSQNAMSAAGEAGKATLTELNVMKRVDSASTGLMAAMRTNELIKKATLTVRKAGSDPLEYFRITLQDARITALELQINGTEISERLSLAYKRINVEYNPQGKDGLARGGMSFETEIT
jgi:type VI secretion system secreted protein Hcp